MSLSLRFIFLFSILILCFQNCGKLGSSITNINSNVMSQGNGGSYGGLQWSGSYYRFTADYSCESKSAPKSMIEVTDNSIRLTENSLQKCSSISKDLDITDIDQSRYQSDIIGYREGIFEGFKTSPTSIPSNLVEVWCRDSHDEQSIETILHYDRSQQKAMQRIYYSKKDSNGNSIQQSISDYPVARVITNQSVIVRDSEKFELTVFRNQPTNEFGLFKAQLKITLDGEQINRETFCRLGGSLDPNIWPAQQITDPNTYPQNLGASNDGKYLAYIARSTPDLSRELFIAKTDGSRPFKINPINSIPSVVGGGLPQALFSTDSQSLLFHAAINPPIYDRVLFKWDFDQSPDQTAIKLPTESQKINSFSLSGDQKFLIYEYDLNIPYKFTSRLKSLNLVTGESFDLTPQATTTSIKGVIDGFSISKTKNKIVYLWSVSQSGYEDVLELYTVNNNGSELTKLSPQLPSAEWQIKGWDSGTNIPNGGDFVFIKAQLGQDIRYFAVSLKNNTSERPITTEIKSGWSWNLTNSNGQLGLISPADTSPALTTEALLINFQTGQTFTLPPLQTFNTSGYDGQGLGNSSINLGIGLQALTTIDKRKLNHPSLFFTDDSRYLVGRTPTSNNDFKAVAISTYDGIQKNICSELTGQDLWLQPITSSQVLIATYNLKNQFLEIYNYNLTDDTCRKINSLLSTNASLETIRELTVSPDKQKILIRVTKKVSYIEYSTQIFYIPLNGQMAYLVNQPLTETAEASMATFTGDSQKVIYLANQSTGSELSVFIWKIP